MNTQEGICPVCNMPGEHSATDYWHHSKAVAEQWHDRAIHDYWQQYIGLCFVSFRVSTLFRTTDHDGIPYWAYRSEVTHVRPLMWVAPLLFWAALLALGGGMLSVGVGYLIQTLATCR